jgi:hypothetical protein
VGHFVPQCIKKLLRVNAIAHGFATQNQGLGKKSRKNCRTGPFARPALVDQALLKR